MVIPPARCLVVSVLVATLAACGGESDEPGPTFWAPGGASASLESATLDVHRVAQAIDARPAGSPLPGDLAAVRAMVADAGPKLARGNSVGGYAVDEAKQNFVVCVQNSSGAHAGFDSTFDAGTIHGEMNGCPQPMVLGLTGDEEPDDSF